MKALVVYDSEFGNTEIIARAIGEVLGRYSLRTWVTFYSKDIGYTLLTRSTLFTLNPTLDTIPWILFDCN